MARLLSRTPRASESAPASRSWPAVFIEVGESENGRTYSAPRLKAAAERGLFENRPINLYRKIDASGRVIEDHVGPSDLVGRSLKNQVALSRETRFDPAAGRHGRGAVVGRVELLDTAGEDARWLESRLTELESKRALESVELSIEGVGDDPDGGGIELEVVHSIDVVSFAAAGGRIGNRIAASRTIGKPSTMKLLLLARLRESAAALVAGLSDTTGAYALAAHFVSAVKADATKAAAIAAALSIDPKRVSESKPDDLNAVLGEAVLDAESKLQADAAAARATPTPPATTTAPAGGTRTTESDAVSAMQRRLDVAESRMRLERAIQRASLPEPSAVRLRESHADAVLDDAAANRLVEAERAHADALIASAAGQSRVTITRTSGQRLTEAFAHMLNPTQVKEPAEGREPWMGSLREFIERNFLPQNLRLSEAVTGGQTARRRLREAIDSTNFDQVFEDALRRSLHAAYVGHVNYASWKKLVRMVPYNDFRTHRIVNLGYYSTLPTVNKGQPYLTLTTPSDREETIALAKKGGLEEILLEDILNDDLTLLQTMQSRLGQAAMETAFETVFALIRVATQPTMTDTYKLTSASRTPVNQGTAVLSADATGKTNLIASIVAMMKGTGGSGQKKGVIPKFCVIPFEKVEQLAYVKNQLTGGNTGTDAAVALRELGVAIPETVIDYGTGNATDWFLLAAPNEAEVLRFGTLGGREEPEIFMADDQRFGSVFTNDKVQMKIRYIYAAAAVDPLGIYGNDAAS